MRVPLSSIAIALAMACAPGPGLSQVPPAEVEAPAYGIDEGAAPDGDDVGLPPGRYHGSWRLVAEADRAEQGLMRFDVQLSDGEGEGTGSFVLYQPFCDAVAGVEITGSADCELIDLGETFDRVSERPDGALELVFSPTADDAEHRLVLRPGKAGLVGEYLLGENDIRLPVLAQLLADDPELPHRDPWPPAEAH